MNTTEFKKHVTNLLKEDPIVTPAPVKTGDPKNPVDTKPELQKYLRDLSVKVSSLKGVDSREIKDLATIINGLDFAPLLNPILLFFSMINNILYIYFLNIYFNNYILI